MTQRILLLALGVALACPLAAARAADHIRVGVVHSLGPAPVFIAAGKGYFAEEGLEAELVFFEPAQPVAAAAGDVDFGCTGMTAAFLGIRAEQLVDKRCALEAP
jgi:NitT/TauT family transport system substrate-binding protein